MRPRINYTRYKFQNNNQKWTRLATKTVICPEITCCAKNVRVSAWSN